MNIERMKAAVQILAAIPASEWKMRIFYTEDDHCGCALGHLAHRAFEGLTLANGCPMLRIKDCEDALCSDFICTGIEAGDVLFGIPFSGLWSPVKLVERRGKNPTVSSPDSCDKEIFFQRLRNWTGEAIFRSFFENTDEVTQELLEQEGITT